MNELRNTVLKTVRERKGNKTILSWNLGNTPYQKLENSFYKPQLIYNQFAFAKWLRDLISEIKLADPSRQVSIDMELNGSVADDIAFLEMQVPGIDSYGLVVTERSPSQLNLTTLNVPHFISKIPANSFLKSNRQKEGYFISDWQDQELNGLVTFDGLRDNWGRNKVALYRMGRVQKTVLKTPALPKVKILKPAVTLYANGKYKYHALVDSENEWKIAGETNFNLEYRWYLVKTDSYGNGTSMKLIGSGANVSVKIPEDGYKHYQLYLNAYRGNDVSTAKTKLNIPLISPGL